MAKEVILRFQALGAKAIGITGGEPLLYPHIIEVLHFIKDLGLLIGLNTNCDYYRLFRDDILTTVDALEIPLEASYSQLHNSIRGDHNFENIIDALNDSFNHSNIIYRIGTVVLPKNVEDLINIEEILAQFNDNIAYWKIYEYISYSNKNMEKNEDAISAFECAKGIELGKYIGRDKIVLDSSDMRSEAYFLVKPNGDIFVPKITSKRSLERKVGNILTDNKSIIMHKWNSFIVSEKYQNCNRCIFRKTGYI